MTNNRLLTR